MYVRFIRGKLRLRLKFEQKLELNQKLEILHGVYPLYRVSKNT